MTAEQRAREVFDFFLRHGWVREEHRKAVSEGIELAIEAAVVDAAGTVEIDSPPGRAL